VAILSSPLTENRPRNLGPALIAIGVVIALLYYGRDFFITLITAITIGFLLEPFVEMFMKLRLPRAFASFLVCSIALLLLYLIGMGLYFQASGLVKELPQYSTRINEIIDEALLEVERAEQAFSTVVVPRRIRERDVPPPQPTPKPEPVTRRTRRPVEPVMPQPALTPPAIQEVRIRETGGPIYNYLLQNWDRVAHVLLLASFVPFLVYFTLSWRDHMRRSYLQLFHGAGRHAAGRSWQGIGDMARAYVVGNFVLGVFLTLASGLFFWAVKVPYFLLVAPLSGFLSLVPYIGVPLAILPPVLAALPAYTKLAPFIMIASVVTFLHLLALNLLYPKLVGSRVHLNPLAVTVALMFWGTLWGPLGLVFAIPVTAGIKAVLDNIPDLQAYGRLLGD
jgi:predicted PurR-regulated permease PerM